MKLIFALLVAGSLNAAQPPPHRPDPLAEHLFPPDLIMQNAEEINLTDEQRDKIEAEMRKAHERFDEMQAKREKLLEEAEAVLKKDRIDESAALAQLEKVLNQERELRRAHLSLMIALKNKLTPEQQAKLEEMKRHAPRPERAEGPPERRPGKPPPASLQEKMKKLKAGVKKLEDEGGDAGSVGEIMREFKPLMDEQKYKQAEEVIDQALKVLREQK
ncbi:MAG TPA: periplasmic heavy metal sensor [Verrucomicrobiae bacterium]|nr:periplasmic heavy metal sensor [Verrucomicrobiae bacterium]